MTGDSAVPRPSRRVKIVLSVFVAFSAMLIAHTPDQASAAAFVPPSLLEHAAANPSRSYDVIVVGTPRGRLAKSLRAEVGQGLGRIAREYSLLRGVATELRGAQLVALARRDSIASITPNGRVKPASANMLWPQAVNLGGLSTPAPGSPTIAIVDSGVETGRADFAGRVVASVNLNSREPNATGDDNGHGTLVAGLAAGASSPYGGAAPSANIVSLDVVDKDGMALTSDVIAAADWIYVHRQQYGIRVANFSLHSAYENYGMRDPLSTAVRRLWLTGTVVVTAAGNAGPQRMLYAPASDPFVITVGALDVNGTGAAADDFNAPWSSYGATAEGFSKPEVAAPGRYLAGPVPASSTLATALPDRVVAPGYMWMSGTSFAAPIVSGAAAQLLARHPSWTPDQVKGALMLTAQAVPNADPLSAGVGEIDAGAAGALTDPPNPNENLYAFVAPDENGTPTLDADAWNAHVAQDASWTSASWTSASWTSASWTIGELDERELDERLLDERVLDVGQLDFRELDVGELDERELDVRVVDVRQLDELTLAGGRGGACAAPPRSIYRTGVNPGLQLPMMETKAHRASTSKSVPCPGAATHERPSCCGRGRLAVEASPSTSAGGVGVRLVGLPRCLGGRSDGSGARARANRPRMGRFRGARPARGVRAAALRQRRPQPQLPQRSRVRRRGSDRAACAARRRARDRAAPARMGEGALPLVHAVLQHRELRGQRPRRLGDR